MCQAGRRINGRSAAEASGDGSRTIPKRTLIYHGTAIRGPWNPDIRPGDNKWTCGIFARNPETGEARWFYQWSPHDVHDWDGINEQILVDLDVNGSKRKVLIRCERNGYIYVMDRLSRRGAFGYSLRAHHDNYGSRFENRSPAIYR